MCMVFYVAPFDFNEVASACLILVGRFVVGLSEMAEPGESDDLWGEELPPPATGRGARGRQPKGEPRVKAKAKSKAKESKPKARKGAVAAGMKMCRTCGEVQPLENFSDNAAHDRQCASTVAGLRRVAVTQNVLAWFLEEISIPDRRRRLCHNYDVRCPRREDAGPRGVFPLLQYQKEVFQERSLIKDTVYEFMDEPAYCAFMARPEKGNVKESKAKSPHVSPSHQSKQSFHAHLHGMGRSRAA